MQNQIILAFTAKMNTPTDLAFFVTLAESRSLSAAAQELGLATPQSAILSAIIFNALIILALVPLALRGVAYRPAPASTLLSRNLAIYGVGGHSASMTVRACSRLVNQCSLRHSSRRRPLKLSMKAFWVGLPGAM